ncbi:MAG: PEGA domain-containing protein [Myxococcota bacterium]
MHVATQQARAPFGYQLKSITGAGRGVPLSTKAVDAESMPIIGGEKMRLNEAKSLPVAVFCLALLFVGSASASSGRTAIIVRGVGAGSDKAASFVAHAAKGAFADDNRFDIVELDETLGSARFESAKKALSVASASISQGRKAYSLLDMDGAVEHFNDALIKFERFAAFVTDFQEIADTLMILGATHILRGEEKAGAKRISQALALVPDVKADPKIFNRSMRAIYEKAKSRLEERPKGALTMNSNPSYAQVFVDGVFQGVTPVTVKDLSPGRHYVHLVKDGYVRWGRVLDVIAGAGVSETATIKPTSRFTTYSNYVDVAFKELQKDPTRTSDVLSSTVDDLGTLLIVDISAFTGGSH